MKIGLYGGTFDPPHPGHTRLAEAFAATADVDLLVVMPTFIPPHKTASGTAAAHRLNMTRLAFLPLGEKGIPYTVSDYEICRGSESYTYLTVRHLLSLYGGELSLCVGGDMLLSLERWKNAEELMEKCTVYAMARTDGEKTALEEHAALLKDKYGARIHIMPYDAYEMSSTELRQALKSGETGKYPLDDGVLAYIRRNGLYRGNTE